MGFIDSVRKLIYIHQLISGEKTGSAHDIGKRIGACRRTVLYYIDVLRDLGASIVYDYKKKSYIYTNQFCLIFKNM
jgi:predicted DNA-binding transcriptional regulator YafY